MVLDSLFSAILDFSDRLLEQNKRVLQQFWDNFSAEDFQGAFYLGLNAISGCFFFLIGL